MKSLLKILKTVIDNIFKILFVIKINFLSKSNIALFDIDNTIANTWPVHNKYFQNIYKKYIELSANINMIDYINEKSKNYNIIYLSCRSPKLYYTTYKWLKKQNLYVNIFNLILVSSPNKKLFYLKYLDKIKINTLYIDDLSYNHENSKIKFYNNLLGKIIKLNNIKHIGYYDIKKINKKSI